MPPCLMFLALEITAAHVTNFETLLQAGGGQTVPGGMLPPHVQRQMGMAAPFPPPAGPNFFNVPPAQSSYPSQDPQQAGTR